MILTDFLLPGSGSGRPKWCGSDRFRIHITAQEATQLSTICIITDILNNPSRNTLNNPLLVHKRINFERDLDERFYVANEPSRVSLHYIHWLRLIPSKGVNQGGGGNAEPVPLDSYRGPSITIPPFSETKMERIDCNQTIKIKIIYVFLAVLRIRIRLDRIRIRVAKISQNLGKFSQKSTKIIRKSYIFFKTIKLTFTDIYIYLPHK